MDAFGASVFLPFVLLSFPHFFCQTMRRDSCWQAFPPGKTRVLDLSYAINDKLVPGPEMKKSIRSEGQRQRREKTATSRGAFGMLEHTGRIWTRRRIFAGQSDGVDKSPVKQLLGRAGGA